MSKGRINTNCPICNKINSFSHDKWGQMVACPDCGNLFVLKNATPVSVKCLECETQIQPGVRICVECGYSFDTGEKVKEHIEVYGEDFSAPIKALNLFVDLFPGLFRISTFVGAFFAFVLAIAMFYFSFVILLLGAVMSFLLLSVGALYVYAHGVAFILTGEVQMLQTAYAEMTGNKWSLFLSLIIAPPVLIFGLLYTILSKVT